MFRSNIENDTENNDDYRKVLFTNEEQQLVVMSIAVGEDIGEEVHPHTSQFIRIESGRGKAVISGKESSLVAGSSVVVSPGEKHNIINTGKEPLKLYTIYSPPKHEEGLVQEDKPVESDMEKCGDMLAYYLDHPQKMKEKQERDKKKVEKGRKLSRRMKLHDMDISIETDKGELRHWYDPHNKEEGTTKMKHPYGYIRRTVGADDENVDVYVGPHEDSKTVYVIHQNKAPDFEEYDEDKVMLGFKSAKDAKAAYLYHYNSPKFFGSMDTMTVSDFKNQFVNKAIGDKFVPAQQDDSQSEQPAQQALPEQPKAQQAPPPGSQQPMENVLMPIFDPLDMNVLMAVQQQLNSIGTMNDKDLSKLSEAVWGDGYQYRPVSPNHVRSELRGYLQDQFEWLKMNPMAQVIPEMGYQQVPAEMPHSSDLSQNSGTGQSKPGDLLNEANLDGVVSESEKKGPSANMA